jgi:hypothetical protein
MNGAERDDAMLRVAQAAAISEWEGSIVSHTATLGALYSTGGRRTRLCVLSVMSSLLQKSHSVQIEELQSRALDFLQTLFRHLPTAMSIDEAKMMMALMKVVVTTDALVRCPRLSSVVVSILSHLLQDDHGLVGNILSFMSHVLCFYRSHADRMYLLEDTLDGKLCDRLLHELIHDKDYHIGKYNAILSFVASPVCTGSLAFVVPPLKGLLVRAYRDRVPCEDKKMALAAQRAVLTLTAMMAHGLHAVPDDLSCLTDDDDTFRSFLKAMGDCTSSAVARAAAAWMLVSLAHHTPALLPRHAEMCAGEMARYINCKDPPPNDRLHGNLMQLLQHTVIPGSDNAFSCIAASAFLNNLKTDLPEWVDDAAVLSTLRNAAHRLLCSSAYHGPDQLDVCLARAGWVGLDDIHCCRVREYAQYLPAPPSRDSAPFAEEWLNCPITLLEMIDPVTASDGNTYERYAIEAHFLYKKEQMHSPLTREVLLPHLFPNRALRLEIDTRNLRLKRTRDDDDISLESSRSRYR